MACKAAICWSKYTIAIVTNLTIFELPSKTINYFQRKPNHYVAFIDFDTNRATIDVYGATSQIVTDSSAVRNLR